jgi:hypothetical protein
MFLFFKKVNKHSGLYYKHILTIVNDACTVNVLTIVIDDASLAS